MKPFYYSIVQNSFAFSTSLNSLLDLPTIPKLINEERVVDYITSVCIDNTSTFYKSINRLPPAHSITITKKDVIISKYWEYEYSDTSAHQTDSDYAENFRELFLKSVECRIHSPNLAIALSGGLDSTSVASVAEKKYNKDYRSPLKVYSGVFEKFIQCDEQKFIKETIKNGNYEWKRLVVDKIDPLESLFELASVHNEPWFAPHLFMYWNLLKTMRDSGVDLLLDGHDGDTVVSHGLEYFLELVDSRDIFNLLKEVSLSRRILTPAGQRAVLKMYFRKNLSPYFNRVLPLALSSRCKNSRKNVSEISDCNALTASLSKSYMERSDVKERISLAKTFLKESRSQRVNHINHVFHPIQPFGLEISGRVAAAFSIEYRCPFWDKRLVEFCLSLPAGQKFKNGWSRSILRRAMEGIIPRKIQWRVDKTDFSPDMVKVRDMLFDENADNLLGLTRKELSVWIDFETLKSYYKSYPDRKHLALFDVWKLLTLYAWLKNNDVKIN